MQPPGCLLSATYNIFRSTGDFRKENTRSRDVTIRHTLFLYRSSCAACACDFAGPNSYFPIFVIVFSVSFTPPPPTLVSAFLSSLSLQYSAADGRVLFISFFVASQFSYRTERSPWRLNLNRRIKQKSHITI